MEIAFDRKRRAKANAIDERKIGLLQKRPALPEKGRIAVDEHRLHWRAGAPRDQGEAALERIDRRAAGTRALGEDKQLPARAQLPYAFAHEPGWHVVADEARKAGSAAQKEV